MSLNLFKRKCGRLWQERKFTVDWTDKNDGLLVCTCAGRGEAAHTEGNRENMGQKAGADRGRGAIGNSWDGTKSEWAAGEAGAKVQCEWRGSECGSGMESNENRMKWKRRSILSGNESEDLISQSTQRDHDGMAIV